MQENQRVKKNSKMLEKKGKRNMELENIITEKDKGVLRKLKYKHRHAKRKGYSFNFESLNNAELRFLRRYAITRYRRDWEILALSCVILWVLSTRIIWDCNYETASRWIEAMFKSISDTQAERYATLLHIFVMVIAYSLPLTTFVRAAKRMLNAAREKRAINRILKARKEIDEGLEDNKA